eukprot:Platyproteum_vivax@DN7186_c0_g1_i2.p1
MQESTNKCKNSIRKQAENLPRQIIKTDTTDYVMHISTKQPTTVRKLGHFAMQLMNSDTTAMIASVLCYLLNKESRTARMQTKQQSIHASFLYIHVTCFEDVICYKEKLTTIRNQKKKKKKKKKKVLCVDT